MPKGPEYVAELVFEAICKQTWYQTNSEGSATLSTGRALWYRNGLILLQPSGALNEIVVAHYSETAVWLLESPGSTNIRRSGGWFEESLVPRSQHALYAAFTGKSPIARVLFASDHEGDLGTFFTNAFSSSDGSLTGYFEGEKSGGLATAITLLILELEEQERLAREREAARLRAERRAYLARMRAEGHYVCNHCEAIDPYRCSYCGICLSCTTSYGSLCSSCDDDDYDD